MKSGFVEMMRRLHHMRSTARISPEGTTPAEARALHVVWIMEQRAEAARPGSVAAHMHTTPSALSQILKALEEKGLLVRHRSHDDFRAVALELTDAGRAVAQETERLHVEHAKSVIAYVGEEDFAHLLRTIGKVLEFHEQRDAADANENGALFAGEGGSHRSASRPCASAPCAPDARASAPCAPDAHAASPHAASPRTSSPHAASASAASEHHPVPEGGPSCA